MRLLQQDKRRLLTSPLSADELDTALLKCTRFIQRRAFPGEITVLMHGRAVGKRSPLHTLHPFLDSQGLLRVGGQLHLARLPYSQRHPTILPKKCHLGRLIIERAHKAAIHGGPALTYSHAIRTTWIIGGRVQARAYVRSCVTSLARDTLQPKDGRPPSVSDHSESTLRTHRRRLRWTFSSEGFQLTRSR